MRQTIELLQRETPKFIPPDLWPPNSPDLNPVDYRIWGVMQDRVYPAADPGFAASYAPDVVVSVGISKLGLSVAARRGRDEGGIFAPGGTVQGRHLEGRKYGILKSGRYWRIGVSIADSDIFTPS